MQQQRVCENVSDVLVLMIASAVRGYTWHRLSQLAHEQISLDAIIPVHTQLVLEIHDCVEGELSS
jgi:hypothetical protein